MEVYLDNNATTSVDKKVFEAMSPYFTDNFGNTGSLHKVGTRTHKAMRESLGSIYDNLNINYEDDVFVTSCGVESNNWVLQSVYRDYIYNQEKNHIITSEVEHPSVLSTCKYLEELGVEVTYLPVDSNGIVQASVVADAITDKTVLVSLMWANNETGAIFPIAEISDVCRKRNVLIHSDGVQAAGKLKIDLKEVSLDFLSFSAHKFHGPKGVAGLYKRKGVLLSPLLHGGAQMGGYRAGTINVASIVGMATALDMAVSNMDTNSAHIKSLRNGLEDKILQNKDTFVVCDRNYRTVNTILVSIRGVEGEGMLWDLNRNGVYASTGSACASEDLEANPIIMAIGSDKELAHTAIRLSLSKYNTQEEMNYVADIFKKSIDRLRSISSSYNN